MPKTVTDRMKVRSLTLTAARVVLYCTCATGLSSCSVDDTAQVTVEGNTTNSTAKSVNERAVAIPAVRNTNDAGLQDRILSNAMEPPEKER